MVYNADRKVILEPGFYANSGSVFMAKIEGISDLYFKKINIAPCSLEIPLNNIKKASLQDSITTPLLCNLEVECSKDSEVDIYPNPAKNFLNLRNLGMNNNHILIFDSMGVLKFEKETFNKELQIELKNLIKGVHFVKIINNSISKVYKFEVI